MAGRVEDARSLVDQVTAANPGSAAAWELSAELDQALGNYEAAEQALDKAEILSRNKLPPRFKRAIARLERGEIEGALQDIDQVEAQMPGFPGLYFARGLVMLRQGLIERGIKSLNEFLPLDADLGYADPALNLAKLYLRDGDSGSARDLMQSVLEQAPGHVEATLALGELDGADGQAAAQRQRLADAVDAYPNEIRFRLALARVLLTAGEPGQSLAVLQTAPSAIKDNPELFLLLGESQMALGALDEAVSIYQSLMVAAPDRAAVAHYLLARAYAQQGNLPAMMESLVRAVELEPGNALVLPTTQLAFKALQSQSEQLALADRMLRAADDDPRIIALKADLLVTLGKHQEAETLIAGLADAYPEDLGVMRKLFAIQRAGANKAGALETLERWHAAAPQDDRVSLMLAQVYAEDQREDEAIALLNVLLETQSGNAVVLNNLAWLLRDRDPEKALSYAERAYRLQPKDPATADTLGLLLVNAGDINRGLSLLDDARIASPNDDSIAFHYAKALVKADRQTEARLILLELASKPFPEQESAKALLKGLGK
jgi:putative PEP-CTERM system TPR-repeat lipoprotein